MKIGIISLGLIGGSLLKALSGKGSEIYVVTRNPATLESAKNYTQNVSSDINLVKECEVVFVCSPMSKTLQILDELESIVSETTIVADVASLKEFVMKKERPYIFIGSHPMAGTENSGFDSSFDTLFNSAKWVVTPSAKAKKEDIEKIVSVIRQTGAHPLFADAKEHDKAAALISHMPMIISQALVKTAMPDSLAVKLASSGFRDTTRLALSNTEMAQDMVQMNSKNISEALIELVECAKNLLDDSYYTEINSIKRFRQNMYDSDGKNNSN